MDTAKKLPDWLLKWIHEGLLGEIYPEIRAIAVEFSPSRELFIRYYLSREPSADDIESVDILVSNVLANTSSNDEIKAIRKECVFSVAPIASLDVLDGLVYAKKET